MKVKVLEKEFIGIGEVAGAVFRQIDISTSAYMYERIENDATTYEVLKRLKSPVCIDFKANLYSNTEYKQFKLKFEKEFENLEPCEITEREIELARLKANIEYKEFYPKSKRFGIDGWAYTSKENAMKKFDELSQINL